MKSVSVPEPKYPVEDWFSDLRAISEKICTNVRPGPRRDKHGRKSSNASRPTSVLVSHFREKYDLETGAYRCLRFRAIAIFLTKWESVLIEAGLIEIDNERLIMANGFLKYLLEIETNQGSNIIPKKAIAEFQRKKSKPARARRTHATTGGGA